MAKINRRGYEALGTGTASGVSAAVVFIWVAEMFIAEPVPGEVAAALGGLLSPLVTWAYARFSPEE